MMMTNEWMKAHIILRKGRLKKAEEGKKTQMQYKQQAYFICYAEFLHMSLEQVLKTKGNRFSEIWFLKEKI